MGGKRNLRKKIVCVGCGKIIGWVNDDFYLAAPYHKTRETVMLMPLEGSWPLCKKCHDAHSDVLLNLRKKWERELAYEKF
jgi:hypothetical protein